MSDELVRLTREELFDLVWSTPMSRLADRFGVSDVALSKTCRRYDVPTPGRGYWAQLAAGQKPARAKLLKSSNTEPIVFRKIAEGAAAGSKIEPPMVVVAEQLTDPHPAVQWLASAFKDAKPDKLGRLVVENPWGPEFSVTKGRVARALLVLDAFVKALEARGHRVEVKPRGDSGRPDMLAFVFEYDFTIELEEKLDRKPHELTKEEKQQKEKWGWSNFPKYEYFANGELALRIARTHYNYTGRKSVSDTKLRRIDDQLGHLVLATELAAELGTHELREAKRQQEEWRAAERRRLRSERLQWYRRWLAEDLERMAADWEGAKRLMSFVAAYETALPDEKRTARDKAWLSAVQAYVRQLDPLLHVTEISKDLEPSDEELEKLVAKYAQAERTQNIQHE
ncbi:hypothetical protein [Pendulispora albinea]|uniref:Uncharacterized protein n=1 Tax=Pendulispora albinea TaxID=2741071 RepID=A0ABZ2LXB5_9BACT